MGKNRMKRTGILLAVFLLTGWLTACTTSVQQSESQDDMEFTVVSEDRLPEELKEIVEGKKESAFKLTYADEGYLYICTGYGKQDSGGYSITVDSLYGTENAIYVNTDLLGPEAGSASRNSPTLPHIVI